jgi:hypothetical protein
MLSFVKTGMVSVAIGVAIGFGYIGWLRINQPMAVETSTVRSPVVLDAGTSPSPVSSPVSNALSVISPEQASKVTATNAQGVPTKSASNNDLNTTPTPTTSLPGPSDFGQYEIYNDDKKYPTSLYGDILVGNGSAVAEGSAVAVNYKGWLTNGTEFDASNPAVGFIFTEGAHKVITGWEEGLLGMKVGGKRRLIIPPGQGYGSAGNAKIPPNSVLIFDVDLLAVK